MDPEGNIYELDEIQDIARLDGFLRGRSEAVKLSGSRRHERLIHASGRGSVPYRKETKMGIEGIEELGASASEDQNDPGDEQPAELEPGHSRVEEQPSPGVETAPETDAHPGEPGDGGHEVSTGHPDDPTQPEATEFETAGTPAPDTTPPAEHPDARPSPSGVPAEGLEATPAPSVDAPEDPQHAASGLVSSGRRSDPQATGDN